MVGSRRRLLTRIALAVMVTAAVLPIAAAPAHADGPVAEFDWEMPARTGLDANHDGVIDVRATRSAIDPASWQVNFDACMSIPSTGESMRRHTWYVDRELIGSPDTQTSPCGGFTYYFPEEGRYEITLEVEDTSGAEAYVIRDILVQDFLVVALGDSFGSGQGNPDVPIPGNLFSATETALVRLDARLAELGTIETDYRETERKVSEVRSRHGHLVEAIAHELDVCNLLSPNYNFDECFGSAAAAVRDATDRLWTALEALGLEALITTLGLIEESLHELMATWDAAMDLARTAVTDAQEAFDAAKAEAAPVWQDKRCNRSSIAGQAQAALELEEADPHTSVTLVHLACSGAEIRTGLIGPYAGVEPPPGAADLPPQVDKAEALIGGREVDAVLVSIGGNDAGFGEMVKACIIQDGCHEWDAHLQAGIEDQLGQLCEVTSFFDADCFERYSRLIERYGGVLPDSAAEIFDDGSGALPGAYRDLADALAAAFPAVAADPARVYISEYPNALEDDDGTICTSAEDGPFDMLPGITLNEGYWLRDTVTRGINGLVAAAAVNHGWTPVGGIFSGFAGHGYCADHGWFRRLQDSFRMQGTMEGVVHPTAAGHDVYGDEYLTELQSDLYETDGGMPNLGAPRPPNPAFSTGHDSAPPSVIGVPDRLPNAAGWYSGPVTIDWQATDPAPSSGTPTDPPDTVASTEGGGVVYTSDPSCDPAGRCATGSLTLSIDETAPTASASASPEPNANGWNNTSVTVSFYGTDDLSGVDSCDQAVVLGSDGAGQSASGGCTDDAGNVSAPATASGINIDMTPPTLVCPLPAPVFARGEGGATVSADVLDGLSGPLAMTVGATVETSSVGAKTVSLTGHDLAGNERTVGCSYIVAYVFDGFSSPVDGGGVLNVVKAGRAIPLKWQLTDASGAPFTALSTVTVTVTVQSLSCSLGTSNDLIEETTAGGSGLQDLGDGYYQMNWKTPSSYAGSCKTMRLDLGEGLMHIALFKFTK